MQAQQQGAGLQQHMEHTCSPSVLLVRGAVQDLRLLQPTQCLLNQPCCKHVAGLLVPALPSSASASHLTPSVPALTCCLKGVTRCVCMLGLQPSKGSHGPTSRDTCEGW
jgi:hypothetical protein